MMYKAFMGCFVFCPFMHFQMSFLFSTITGARIGCNSLPLIPPYPCMLHEVTLRASNNIFKSYSCRSFIGKREGGTLPIPFLKLN